MRSRGRCAALAALAACLSSQVETQRITIFDDKNRAHASSVALEELARQAQDLRLMYE